MKETLVEICTNKHDVDYLLIGGVAVVYHAYTRSTADLDFWYNPTGTNFHKIINAIKEYGIDASDLERIVFDPKKNFLRFPTSAFQTVFLPAIPGDSSFKEAKAKAEILKINNTQVFIIGYKISSKQIVYKPIKRSGGCRGTGQAKTRKKKGQKPIEF